MGTTPLLSAYAVEFIHTNAPLFDNLPCRDNAENPRGRNSTHCVYGEGSTVLASFALLLHAKEASLSRVMRKVSRVVSLLWDD